MDYLTFEVLTTTTVTVTSGFGGNRRLQLAQFIGFGVKWSVSLPVVCSLVGPSGCRGPSFWSPI